MPEFVEAEAYRRTLDPILGHTIIDVDIRDARLLRRSDTGGASMGDLVLGAMIGSSIDSTRRTGKVVFADLSSGHSLAFGFGLRGRFALDGCTATTTGEPRQVRIRSDHIRLAVSFGRADAATAAHELVLEDQLRLATLDLDVDEERLGVDVLDLDKATLRRLLTGSEAAVKSMLMDQRRVAGIGNLIADEILYQGRIDPRRPAGGLSSAEVDRLWIGLRRTRQRVLDRGGSHRGVMIDLDARRRGAACPRCDKQIERVRVAGRTTYFCPAHQR